MANEDGERAMVAAPFRFMDEAETARLLRNSRRTLQRWRAEGGGPAFVRAGGRRILYDIAEVERWAAARTFPHRAAELVRRAGRST